MDGLAWLGEHWDYVKGLACKVSGQDREFMIDDLMNVAIDKLPRLVQTYNPAFGLTFKQYVMNSLRRYMIKEVIKQSKPFYELDENIPAEEKINQVELFDEVYIIMNSLSDRDKCIIISHHLLGKTLLAIAKENGVHYHTARNHYIKAMRNARAISARQTS